MKPPVEHVKVSAKGREILIRVKRHTGLEHWNEICRIALCRSLANPNLPPQRSKAGDSNIDMDWKTFAGQFADELTALILIRAQNDKVDIYNKSDLSEYFRAHLERGIATLQGVRELSTLVARKLENHSITTPSQNETNELYSE